MASGCGAAFWGDSLTNGSVGTAATMTAAGYVENYWNGGVGGEASAAIKNRFLADRTRIHWTQVIWVGQNWDSQATTLASIAAMIAPLSHTRYLVVSTINNGNTATEQGPAGARYLEILALNAALEALYGSRFYDLREALVADGVAEADAQSVDYDAPPSYWQPTDVHLNDDGYTEAQTLIRAKLNALGFLSEASLREAISLCGNK